MTNREAIKQLEFDMAMILFNPDTGEELTLEQVKYQNEDNYRTYLTDKLAISALEKQEPMKPINITCFAGRTVGNCPSCGAGTNIEKNYCSKCGQKLDWTEGAE